MKFSEYSLPILAMRLDQAPKTGRLKIGVSVDRNSISLRPNLKKVGGDGCFSIERNDSHNLSSVGINEKTAVLGHFYELARN
jgi:hypothetical protein